MADQAWLLAYENPLLKKFEKDFFKGLPTTPGVYFMLGQRFNILYVGKAKNLRARLYSYRRAKPGQVSRKVLRMLGLVVKIEWELCESEQAALLRENQLLRQHRPPFNVVNTNPESYYFIGLRLSHDHAELRLTTHEKAEDKERLFGAYKGRRLTRDGFGALLRLLWATQNTGSSSGAQYFPLRLVRHRPPYSFQIQKLPREWQPYLKKFLGGSSDRLLELIAERLLDCPEIPRFVYRIIQDDLQNLRDFYQFGPKRVRWLKRKHSEYLQGQTIPQELLDDLLVLYRR